MNQLRLGAFAAACALCGIATRSGAQADIHFSQFYETSILRNPAMTGVFTNDYKVGLYYRNQWSSISNPFVTAVVSGETRVSVSRVSEDYLSFGLIGYTDKAGSVDQRITGVYPALNYNKSINPEHNSYLSVGFTGGYLQYSFDPSKATFDNMYQNNRFSINNPSGENLPNAKMTFWDVGAGVNFNTSSGPNNNVTYIIGIAGYHFTQPKFSYFEVSGLNQNMRWNGNAALGFNATQEILVQFHANYAMQGTYREVVTGGIVSWRRTPTAFDPEFGLAGGLFYRLNDAIIPVVRVKYKNASLGVSYDVNTSTLKPASNLQGAYEMTLFIGGNFTDKSGITQKTVCPKF